MKTMFRKGHRVWDAIHGWGEVEKVEVANSYDMYPVYVSFENGDEECYTVDGKNWVLSNVRHLFFDEIVPHKAALTPPERFKWRASANEEYFYINSAGSISSNYDNGLLCDNAMYEIGNYFRTRGEAELKLLEFLKIFAD